MGFFNFFKSRKPDKKRLKMLQEELEAGRILKHDDDVDNLQFIREAHDDTEQD